MRLSRRYRYGAVPPNSITYTHAISACRSDVESVRFLLDLARNDGLEPNVYMYSAAIWSCGDDADAALDILEQMQMADNNCAPNVVSYNGVISSLAIQGRAEEALSLFEEMKDANVKPNRITFQVSSECWQTDDCCCLYLLLSSFTHSNSDPSRNLPLPFVLRPKTLPSRKCSSTFFL